MSYIKIANRNLKQVEVVIISAKHGVHKQLVREDRRNRYINDYILFNNLRGQSYMIKELV
jgi:hypothetical protein